MLGRDDIGSLEPGKCADFAVWGDDWIFSGADDPVAALVFGGPHPVSALYVGGREVIADVPWDEIAADHGREARRFAS